MARDGTVPHNEQNLVYVQKRYKLPIAAPHAAEQSFNGSPQRSSDMDSNPHRQPPPVRGLCHRTDGMARSTWPGEGEEAKLAHSVRSAR